MATEVLTVDYKSSCFAHTAATVAKLFYVINGMVWLALNTAGANEDNVFVYGADMLRVPKATGQAWAPGTKVYYDAGASNFTTTASGNTLAGIVNEPADAADVEGIIDFQSAAFVNA